MIYKNFALLPHLFLAFVCFGLFGAHQIKAQSCSPPPVGLAASFQAENNALDSRSRNNGVLQNGTAFAPGRVGQAFDFDGVNDNVTVPNSASINITGNQLTLEAWVYPTFNDASAHQIVAMATGTDIPAGRKYGLFVGPSGDLVFEVNTTDGYVGNLFGAILPLNTFTHVAGTYDGSTMNLYINGAFSTSRPLTGNIVSSTGNLTIGQFAVDGYSTFQGLIDEVGIYDRALSPAEIQAIVNAGSAGKCRPMATATPNNLAAWYAGDGEARDLSAQNSNGILHGDTNFTTGKVAQAFNFDGNGDYIEIADDAANRPTVALTAEGWFKLNATFGTIGLVSKPVRNSISDAYQLFVESGVLQGLIGDAGGFDRFQSTFAPQVGVWYHFAFTFDDAADVGKLYVNGVEVLSQPTTRSLSYDANPFPLLIGADFEINNPQFFLDGQTDEVSIYSRALSQTEIQSIYNASLAGKLKQKSFTSQTSVQISDATINFSGASSGTAQEIPLDGSMLPPVPAGTPKFFFDAATDFPAANASVCFNVASIAAEFANLRIYHLENGIWQPRTAASTSPNLCTTALSSLSPFAIVQLAPTAATATVSGRVFSTRRRGAARAAVTLTDSQGESRRAITNSFGFYRFEDVAVGETYIFTVKSKQYKYAPQVVNITYDVNDLNFAP